MIDVFKEQLIDFKTASRLAVFSRGGHPAHISKIHRCHRPGIKGPSGERVALEAIRTPSGWMTSREAIQRWLNELTTGDATPADDRDGEHERAENELTAAGI